jgi:ribosomal protein S21
VPFVSRGPFEQAVKALKKQRAQNLVCRNAQMRTRFERLAEKGKNVKQRRKTLSEVENRNNKKKIKKASFQF